MNKQYELGIAELENAATLSESNPRALAWLGNAYAVSGRKGKALEILASLENSSASAYVSPLDIAIIYVGLGEKDKAFKWLEKGFEDRSGYMEFLKIDAFFDPLRSDPRFADLLRRMNLQP